MPDKQHWFNVLAQTMQVPVNQAEAAAEVLAKESADSSYKRTAEDQEAVSSAWQWWVAKGSPTEGSEDD